VLDFFIRVNVRVYIVFIRCILKLVKRFTKTIYIEIITFVWGTFIMKKVGILNSELAYTVAQMGHKDTLAIGDAGLPVPAGTKKIDLAVTFQTPDFQTVLENVLTEMQVEAITLAEEIKTENPDQLAAILAVLPNVDVTFVPHEEFKQQLGATRAVVRTGESHPFANIILRSGVAF